MKKKQSKLSNFAILTTLTVLTWVVVETYLTFTKTSLVSVPEEALRPLDPTLDTQTLDNIERRLFLSEEEITEQESEETSDIEAESPPEEVE